LTPPKFPAEPPPTTPSPPAATSSSVAATPARFTAASSPRTAAEPRPAAPVPTLTIDALGRKCPIPIIMLAERIREVPIGHVVAVLADDPAAETDVPAWCMLKTQEFVAMIDLPGAGWAFLVRRSY
jgi:tRNA 2-thiouridine synthesizing protein A